MIHFWLFFLIISLLLLSFFLVKRTQTFRSYDKQLFTYSSMLKISSTITDGELYALLIKKLCQITNAPGAFIAQRRGESSVVDFHAIMINGILYDAMEGEISDTVDQQLKRRHSICVNLAEWNIPAIKDDFNCYAVLVVKPNGKSSGLIGVLSHKKLRQVDSLKPILNIFAQKVATEFERAAIDTENRLDQDRLFLERKMESLSTVTANIAHDFNNHLNSILGYSELLRKKIGNEPQLIKFIDGILSSAKASVGLTEKLNAFSRKSRTLTTSVDLQKILIETINVFRQKADANVKLVTCFNADNVCVNGDLQLLSAMFLELLSNAYDFLRSDGHLLVASENVFYDKDQLVGSVKPFLIQKGSYITVSIGDNGIGMDSDVIEHLYEPFFTAKRDEKRAGLGLATVWGCVKSHNGYIDVSSESGAGTTFTVYLPTV